MKYLNIEPLRDHLFVEPILRSEAGMSKGGILLKRAKEQGAPIEGRVYKVAENVIGIKPGMRVIFEYPSPQGFKIETKEGKLRLFRLHCKQVKAIVDET